MREDYSADGEAWSYLPHDHARSRAYRWGEDGLAGFCDVEQRLCLGLALWNGRDPILKERIFGLTGDEGNHGEDAKEYWWFLDAVPSHAWNRWRYHYPRAAFPYERLVEENARRGRRDPEFELLDTGVFDDDRYWVVDVDYAKASPFDLLMTIRVTNAGPDADTLHVLPQLWYRNTWSWDGTRRRPVLAATGPPCTPSIPFLGPLTLHAGPGPDGAAPSCCSATTRPTRTAVSGRPGRGTRRTASTTTSSPARPPSTPAQEAPSARPGTGSRWRAARPSSCGCGSPPDNGPIPSDRTSPTSVAARRAEADAFYAELTPAGAAADEARVMRQAFAGMLWSKQFYFYDVARWLDGDPAQPPPPPQRHRGRNARWRSFDAYDLLSMPDTWEYPWFAAWDMAFHAVTLAHIDPAFAKYQLTLLCREWFQHPNGALPAYEWDFGDVNPPVHAWAALEVFALDGGRDLNFLSRVFDKLLVNFTWWVNREDANGSNLFEGGFMGLDNIGPIDRSHLPVVGTLEQSDSTGWMAGYAATMATIAAILHCSGHRPAVDLVQTFLEHFALIRDALDGTDLWDDADGMFYDRLAHADGASVPIRVRSIASMIPMMAGGVVSEEGMGSTFR